MIELLNNIWAVVLDTAFWLLIGLLAAGIIKTYIPEEAMRRWVGGKGLGAVSRAALFGAPLPLCSCGVLPAAIGLHRAGASKEATVSFLISTPETSIDSVAVTYALMGPVMAIYRPVAALMSAVITGMLTSLIKDEVKAVENKVTDVKTAGFNANETTIDAGSRVGFNANETTTDAVKNTEFNANETTVDAKAGVQFNPNDTAADAKAGVPFKANDTSIDARAATNFNVEDTSQDAYIGSVFNANDTIIDSDIAFSSRPVEQTVMDCCSSKESASVSSVEATMESSRWFQSLKYASAELLDDISKWLAIGIVLAGIMLTYIPTDWLAQWGSGLTAMLVMLVVGIPLYICAVASTPVAAGLLLAGVSPGAVLVFLLVGPATNIASFALIKQELGLKVTIVYLLGLSVVSLAMGLLLEFLLLNQNWQIVVHMGEADAMLPTALAWGSAIVLLFLAIKPLRKTLLPQLG